MIFVKVRDLTTKNKDISDKNMKVLYKIAVCGKYETKPEICEVPDFELIHHSDGTVTSTAHEIDEVEEAICDAANNFVTVRWKLPDEPDICYRETQFPEWDYIGELVNRINQLENELEHLKMDLGNV